MLRLRHNFSQVFPPAPQFTEKQLGDLAGKVYIVTGANTGVGKALAEILYAANAKVYVAARSKSKGNEAIEAIKGACQESKGTLVFLPLDLADLTTIKASASEFLAKETKLHVLFNNAGVMSPPDGSKTAQGYELQLGTNNIGTFLFTKLLTPTLVSTASSEAAASVRVVWVSSSAAEIVSPRGGVPLDNLDYHQNQSPAYKYGVSKAGNYFHSAEFARRHRESGIVSIALNPGNLRTDLFRHRLGLERSLFSALIQYPPIYGAYTELFAGLSPDITMEQSGLWGKLPCLWRKLSVS